jgi:hypothetical protein
MSTNVPSRQAELTGIYIGMVVPATVLVVVRLLSRHFLLSHALGSDDWTIGVAIILTWIHTGLGLACMGGSDISFVTDRPLKPH